MMAEWKLTDLLLVIAVLTWKDSPWRNVDYHPKTYILMYVQVNPKPTHIVHCKTFQFNISLLRNFYKKKLLYVTVV